MLFKFLRIFSAETKSSNKKTTFLHAKHEGGDTVACAHLEVVISHDDDFWYAQGRQIDYIAQGHSLDEVQERFMYGLSKTVNAHIKKFGSVDNLLNSAPEEAFSKTAIEPTDFTLNFVRVYPKEYESLGMLPFHGLRFATLKTATR